MLDFSKYEKGFYKVNNDGAWVVMYFDGIDWYDHISGQYDSCDQSKWITKVGEKIELPEN